MSLEARNESHIVTLLNHILSRRSPSCKAYKGHLVWQSTHQPHLLEVASHLIMVFHINNIGFPGQLFVKAGPPAVAVTGAPVVGLANVALPPQTMNVSVD